MKRIAITTLALLATGCFRTTGWRTQVIFFSWSSRSTEATVREPLSRSSRLP